MPLGNFKMIPLDKKVEHFWNQTKPFNNCQKSTFWLLWYDNSLQPNGLCCKGTLCGTLSEWPVHLSISQLTFQKCNLARIRLEAKTFRVCLLDNWLEKTHFHIKEDVESFKRTSVQKSNKNEIFMARVKNSNCLNFCTQVDPSKTRKAVYFFSLKCILIFEKNELFVFTLWNRRIRS